MPSIFGRAISFSKDIIDRVAGRGSYSAAAAPQSGAPNKAYLPSVPSDFPGGSNTGASMSNPANQAYPSGGGRQEPWFGPGQPMLPAAPDNVKGRQWDYPYSSNLSYQPRRHERVSFEQLEGLADFDMVRLAIETRKDQMAKLEWSVVPKISQQDEVRKPADDRCREVQQFMLCPDKVNSWHDWSRMIMDEALTTDATSI